MILAMGIGAPELLILLLIALIVTVVPVFALYWLVRVAARHGVTDAMRRESTLRR